MVSSPWTPQPQRGDCDMAQVEPTESLWECYICWTASDEEPAIQCSQHDAKLCIRCARHHTDPETFCLRCPRPKISDGYFNIMPWRAKRIEGSTLPAMHVVEYGQPRYKTSLANAISSWSHFLVSAIDFPFDLPS